MADLLNNAIAQNLECPVCLHTFRDPKILSCSHTYCKTCLDNLLQCHANNQTLRCPVCRAETQLPNKDVSELQTNLVLKSLIEEVEKGHQVCTNCKSKEKPKAVVYCQDCRRYLCVPCQSMHSKWDAFSDHVVLDMSEVTSGEVSIRTYRKCRKHPKEDEECFCCNCRRFACFRCVVMEHKEGGHRVIEASVYESNHLKSIEDLKSKADKKLLCFQKYNDFIDRQKDRVSNTKKQCIDHICKTYEESVRKLTERKTHLIGEVKGRIEEVEKELDKMKKSTQRQIAHLTVLSDLVTNRTKIPLEMDALAAHDMLCQDFQEALRQPNPDNLQPRRSIRKGINVAFERNRGQDELGLGKIVNSVTMLEGKNIALPTQNKRINAIVPTSDGRMAVGCSPGGINIFSADGQLQETGIKKVRIRGMGFLCDGRYAVLDISNNVTLYTPEYEKLDVTFETLSDEEGLLSDLAVDSDDQIYVSFRKAKKIQIFSPAGGKAIKEIPCVGYKPMQIVSLYHNLLVTKSGSDSVSVVDNQGVVRHKLTDPCGYNLHATVTQDNSILVACIKCKERLVSIDEYTNELKHVRNLITDYKIEKSANNWHCLQEFRSGEIAFCTFDRLYIFHREMYLSQICDSHFDKEENDQYINQAYMPETNELSSS